MNVGWLFAHSATPLQELRHVETNGEAYHMRAIATEEVPPSVVAVIAATIGVYCEYFHVIHPPLYAVHTRRIAHRLKYPPARDLPMNCSRAPHFSALLLISL